MDERLAARDLRLGLLRSEGPLRGRGEGGGGDAGEMHRPKHQRREVQGIAFLGSGSTYAVGDLKSNSNSMQHGDLQHIVILSYCTVSEHDIAPL